MFLMNYLFCLQGSVCLYYRPLKVLFTGDHLYRSGKTGELDIALIYNKQSGKRSVSTLSG
jgi:glyoxylase-like metal-dependent hydrolase (beta-lactamase superfamily II)